MGLLWITHVIPFFCLLRTTPICPLSCNRIMRIFFSQALQVNVSAILLSRGWLLNISGEHPGLVFWSLCDHFVWIWGLLGGCCGEVVGAQGIDPWKEGLQFRVCGILSKLFHHSLNMQNGHEPFSLVVCINHLSRTCWQASG